MRAFIGRQSELSQLERIYEQEEVKACMIYGRRRIGKSALIRRFCADKRALMMQFVRSSRQMNVEIMGDAIRDIGGRCENVDDMHQAFKAIESLCASEKTVVVFDEISYLLDGEAAATEMQRFVDAIRATTDSMIIICGSSISFMMDEVLNRKRPLYGRFAFCIELGPLSISEIRGFHPSASDVDLLKLYLTLGGIPAYHELVGDRSYRDAVDECLMNSYSAMTCDIPYDISEEMGRMSDDAFSILSSISSGYNTFKQIAGRTGLNDNRISNCLERMQVIRLLEKMESVPIARKSHVYVIRDRLTSFFFSMRRYSSLVEGGSFYDSASQMISSHLGSEFESYCRDLVLRSYPCIVVGSWWGAVPVRDEDGKVMKGPDGKVLTEDVDIDLTAVLRSGQDSVVLYGECKFTGRSMGFSSLNRLMERIDAVNHGANIRMALFSVSGFDDDLGEYASSNGVALFGLRELIGESKPPEIPSIPRRC